MRLPSLAVCGEEAPTDEAEKAAMFKGLQLFRVFQRLLKPLSLPKLDSLPRNCNACLLSVPLFALPAAQDR